ncbi:MAG: hypothetical protein RL757_2958 [Bacteroidota bacterium]|jgi:hypothetical protein
MDNKFLENMDSEVQLELQDLSPTLARVRNATAAADGFKMPPPQYFDHFFEQLQLEDDESLLLESLKNDAPPQDGFKTPEGYFDGLNEKVLAKIAPPQYPAEKKTQNWNWRRNALRVAAAAAIATTVFVGVDKWKTPTENVKNGEIIVNNAIPNIQNVENGVENQAEINKNVEKSAKPNNNVENVENVSKNNSVVSSQVEKTGLNAPIASVAALSKIDVDSELDKILTDFEGDEADLQESLQLSDEELQLVVEENGNGI